MGTAMTAAWSRELLEEAGMDQLSKPDLKQRFVAWFDSQPEISRNRPYAMVELEQATGAPGRQLSAVLLSLGWERRRKWSKTGQSPRYWVPPTQRWGA
ncbi:hypothetical protein [Novosphingobium sp. CF614]|uniref:hypothetical protein n=1 Tax=Novosphingobium sp. CF614 TaxID=1884364 RepID=UPI0015A68D03|nr:hypothetical protein [Novosphingobium sp. CF614]